MLKNKHHKGYHAASLHRYANVETPQGSFPNKPKSTIANRFDGDTLSRQTGCCAVAQRQCGRLADCEAFPLLYDTGRVQTVLSGRMLAAYNNGEEVNRRQL